VIKNLLRSVKDSIDPVNRKGVYMIPCLCGKSYVGEIGRSVKIRIKYHVVDIRHNCVHSPVLVEHSDKTKNHICIEKAKISVTMDHQFNRKFREANEIERRPDNLNRDDG
jgi:hypothetical protein